MSASARGTGRDPLGGRTLRVLTIQYDSGPPPTFRVFGEAGAPRIVVVMVQQHHGGRDNLWVIGPPGMRMTEYEPEDFHLVERRPATPDDVKQIFARSEQLLGHAAIPIGTIQYGIVPAGFVQMKPTTGAAPPLGGGEQYEVVVMAAGDFGSLEFTA